MVSVLFLEQNSDNKRKLFTLEEEKDLLKGTFAFLYSSLDSYEIESNLKLWEKQMFK